MMSSFGLEIGFFWRAATDICKSSVPHTCDTYLDYGRTRAICTYITFAFFTSAFSLISIRTGGTGERWGGGTCLKSLPPEIQILTVLQFIMLCLQISGPSAVLAIHMCTIHKSYTYACNFCLSPYYIEYTKFLSFYAPVSTKKLVKI